MPELSIIIPMHDEAGNAGALLAEIAALRGQLPEFEVIVVDDASTDGTGKAAMSGWKGAKGALRLLRHPVQAGQSAAIHNGVMAARSPICAMLDGDGQNPPGELVALVARLAGDGADRIGLVAGQRVGRQDSWSRRAASRFANGLRSWLLADGTRDTGCGLKAFRRNAYLALPYFDHMHRYLPALFKREGWEVALVDVSHRERGAGQSNYTNFNRALVGIYDLFGVTWLIRRKKRARAGEAPVIETEAAAWQAETPSARKAVDSRPPKPPKRAKSAPKPKAKGRADG